MDKKYKGRDGEIERLDAVVRENRLGGSAKIKG